MNCREAVDEVFRTESGILTTRDVIGRINARYPARPWKNNTISCHLMGMSINHPSRHYYAYLNRYAILFSLGNGRYRRVTADDNADVVPNDDNADEDTVIEGEEESEVEDLVGAALSIERDLEQFLSTNLSVLGEGLTLYTSNGVCGRQVSAGGAGEIDLLGVDKNSNLVVIELKAGTAHDQVSGQILRYMGWVKKHLAGEESVRGIIVANDFTEKMKYAALAMPNVSLVRYRVSFQFGAVGQDEF
ncbi:MAG: endonuclease NucS [bacterium]|nr:endonuclease NucS [bacterium]